MTIDNKIWWPEQKEGMVIKIFAFLISPILGLFSALLRPNTRSSYAILFLSFITLGITMIAPEDRTENMNFDCIEYRMVFEEVANQSSADFHSALSNYSQQNEDGDSDIYLALLFYSVSRITKNYHVCFGIIAIIFSIFMLKSMRFLVSDSNYSISALCLILLFIFTLAQIGKINMFRFYTAYWIALYALFKIIIDKNRRYWILLALTPAVHGSFFIIFVIFALYKILRNRPTTAIVIVIFGFLFSSIAVQVFSWILLHLPDSLGGHYGGYINEWYIYRINKEGSGNIWMVRLMELAVRISINIITIFFAIKYFTHIKESKVNNIYFFLLAITAFVNFTFMIPSVGSRYAMFTFPFIAYIWLICFSQERKWNWLIYSFAGIYLFFFLVLPWNIYQIPCFRFYTRLWDADILYQSPIFLWIKYLFFPPA
jgi:hypothetical protein